MRHSHYYSNIVIKFLLLVILGITNTLVYGQNSRLPIVPKFTYKKAIIYDTLYRKMEVGNLLIKKDSITFLDETDQFTALPLQDIAYLKVRNGNYWLEGLGGGAISSLLVVLLNPQILQSAALTGVACGGTIAIGGLIGLCSLKTKSYRVR